MPLVLRRVGRFEILREIGRGGMGTVYLARDTLFPRNVALKELAASHRADPAFGRRFIRESDLAASLNHPNIVVVYDRFDHNGAPYIAMEYVEGGSLRPWVGRLTLAQIAGVLEGLLAGLSHACTRGVVHRDLKPENVMVSEDGRIKIVDFGIAKAYDSALTSGQFPSDTRTAVGTPTYMAPEQAMAKDVGPWTDLYSAGVMAYELIVGRVPFHEGDALSIMVQHRDERPPSPRELEPHLDERLSTWIEQLLEKKPEDRPPSASKAWDELEDIIDSVLGHTWRKEARLIEKVAETEESRPLTPAVFTTDQAGDASPVQGGVAVEPPVAPPPPVSGYDTYDSGEAQAVPEVAPDAAGGVSTAPPKTPEPGESADPGVEDGEPTPATESRPTSDDGDQGAPASMPEFVTVLPAVDEAEQGQPASQPAQEPEPDEGERGDVLEPAAAAGAAAVLEPAADTPAPEPQPEPVPTPSTDGGLQQQEPADVGAETIPPARRWIESFQLPSIGPGTRSRRVWAIVAGGILAAAGVAIALVFAIDGDHGTTSTGQTTTGPLDGPVPAAEQARLAVADSAVFVSAPNGHLARLGGLTLRTDRQILDPARPRSMALSGETLYVAEDATLSSYRADTLEPVDSRTYRASTLVGGDDGVVAALPKGGGTSRLCQLNRRCVGLGFVPSGVGSAPGRVFLADGEAGTLRVVPAATLVPSAPIPVGTNPHGRIVELLDRVYVPIQGGVAVVDLSSRRLVRTIPLPGTPTDILIVPTNGLLVASLYQRRQLAVVDTASPTAEPRLITTPGRPVALAGPGARRGDVFATLTRPWGVIRVNARTGRQLRSVRLPTLGGETEPLVALPARMARQANSVIATIPFDGRVDTARLRAVDGTIGDGRASFELWQGGIRTKAGPARTANGVTLAVAPRPGRLLFRVQTGRGDFRSVAARVTPGAVLITLVRAPEPTPQPTAAPTAEPTPNTPRPTATAPPRPTSTPRPEPTATPQPTITIG